jgi:large subunit ribosomal protein L20
MPRAKGGPKTRARRKRVLNLAEGYWGAKSKLFRSATEAVDRALKYAYRDRKARKRDFRRLWIARINAAARLNGVTYSKFIAGLAKNGVAIEGRSCRSRSTRRFHQACRDGQSGVEEITLFLPSNA